jgi:hypothetical protein
MDSRPGCFEKQGIELLRVLQTKPVDRVGQGENHMKVAYRQQVCLSLHDPLLPISGLAFRAVSVAATIITDTQMATAITGINVSTQACCAAMLNSL